MGWIIPNLSLQSTRIEVFMCSIYEQAWELNLSQNEKLANNHVASF